MEFHVTFLLYPPGADICGADLSSMELHVIFFFFDRDISTISEAVDQAGGYNPTVFYWIKDGSTWLQGARMANDVVQPLVVAFFGDKDDSLMSRY